MEKRLLSIVLFVSALFLFTPSSLFAESDSAPSRKFGMGLQAAPFPIFGLSARYNPIEKIGVELFGMGLIDMEFLAFRSQYRFVAKPSYNLYCSGLAGIFSQDGLSEGFFGGFEEKRDTAPGYGIGGGFEYFFGFSKRKFGANIEIDFIRITFQDKWWQYDYEVPQLVMAGLGFHYYF